MRADVDVERARGRGGVDAGERRRANAHEAILQLPDRPPRCAQQGACATAHLAGHGRALQQRLAEQLRRARQRAGHPGNRRARGGGRLGRRVEQDGGDVHAGDPVDERMVGLCDQRKTFPGHPLHEPDLPQRLGAIQALREQPPGELLQCGVVGGSWQGGVADVVARVEMRVVGPYRPALPERHVGKPLAIARHQVQAAEDVIDELLRRGRLALEDHHRRDVHVRGRVVLQVQERGIERGQAVWVGHGSIVAASGAHVNVGG